jgi:glutaconate CoA-transferase subunit A
MSRRNGAPADADRSGRASVVVAEDEVAGLLASGMTIAIGGFINSGHPMALVRQIIRRELRDLTIVGAASSGLEVDMLIAAGCARKLISPYVGAEGLASIGPAFRAAAERGEIDLWEVDEAQYYAGLRASAQRLPFNPWRAGVGTSYPRLNPDFKEFRDPINNELLIAVPAIEIDVALLHAAVSDIYGNVQHHGTGYGDRAIFAAADTTVVTVERLVSNETVRANPAATSVPGAHAVVRVPYGAHPFAADGFYPADEAHITDYVRAADDWRRSGSRTALDEYFDRFVLGAPDHARYLERVGFQQILSLTEFDG